MTVTQPRHAIAAQSERPYENERTAFLWVVAVLIAVIELAWWLADRIYRA